MVTTKNKSPIVHNVEEPKETISMNQVDVDRIEVSTKTEDSSYNNLNCPVNIDDLPISFVEKRTASSSSNKAF